MKNIHSILHWFCLLLCVMGFIAPCFTQKGKITSTYKNKTITTLSQLLEDYYVFPDKATETATHLRQLHKNGHFDQFQNLETFAQELTKCVYAIAKDRHISITLKKTPGNTEEAVDPTEA